MSYVIPCNDPRFSQVLDKNRSHTLLTTNTKQSGQLLYRYNDTGEETLVPNVWYNQTYQCQVESLRWYAQQDIERAIKVETRPPVGMTKAASDQIAQRYREKAARLNEEADRIQSEGEQNTCLV
jgi:hypothetical protein